MTISVIGRCTFFLLLFLDPGPKIEILLHTVILLITSESLYWGHMYRKCISYVHAVLQA